MKISAKQVITEAFEANTVRSLFGLLYQKSPVGKDKFQEIAKQHGEAALTTPDGFSAFAAEIGFSGIKLFTDGTVSEYEFNSLFGIENMPK